MIYEAKASWRAYHAGGPRRPSPSLRPRAHQAVARDGHVEPQPPRGPAAAAAAHAALRPLRAAEPAAPAAGRAAGRAQLGVAREQLEQPALHHFSRVCGGLWQVLVVNHLVEQQLRGWVVGGRGLANATRCDKLSVWPGERLCRTGQVRDMSSMQQAAGLPRLAPCPASIKSPSPPPPPPPLRRTCRFAMVLPTRSRTVPRTTTATVTLSPSRRCSTVSSGTWGRGNHEGTSITTRTARGGGGRVVAPRAAAGGAQASGNRGDGGSRLRPREQHRCAGRALAAARMRPAHMQPAPKSPRPPHALAEARVR